MRRWLLLLLPLLLSGCAGDESKGPEPPPWERPIARLDAGRGFATPADLRRHWLKHRRDYPGLNANGYLRRAQALRDRPVDAMTLHGRQRDGDYVRFDRRNGDFLVFRSDRRIRTLFRPRQGERYFRKQITH